MKKNVKKVEQETWSLTHKGRRGHTLEQVVGKSYRVIKKREGRDIPFIIKYLIIKYTETGSFKRVKYKNRQAVTISNILREL